MPKLEMRPNQSSFSGNTRRARLKGDAQLLWIAQDSRELLGKELIVHRTPIGWRAFFEENTFISIPSWFIIDSDLIFLSDKDGEFSFDEDEEE